MKQKRRRMFCGAEKSDIFQITLVGNPRAMRPTPPPLSEVHMNANDILWWKYSGKNIGRSIENEEWRKRAKVLNLNDEECLLPSKEKKWETLHVVRWYSDFYQ